MQEKMKGMEVGENGYIQLQLASKNDVDEYMLQLIQEHDLALNCMQDKRMKTKFLYDVRGYLSLACFFSLWKFTKQGALEFLISLIGNLCLVEESMPLLLECDGIYVNANHDCKVVVLPIHEHNNASNDVSAFLTSLMKRIEIIDDYEILGYLFQIQQRGILTLAQVKQALLEFEGKEKWFNPFQFYQRKQVEREREDENSVRRDKELGRLRLFQEANEVPQSRSRSIKKEISKKKGDTVVLFSQKLKGAYIEDATACRYPIESELLLGRSKSCDVVIPDATISSQHAAIRKTSHGYELEDYHSSNETSLNGVVLKPNQPYELHDQDRIQLADFELKFCEEKK